MPVADPAAAAEVSTLLGFNGASLGDGQENNPAKAATVAEPPATVAALLGIVIENVVSDPVFRKLFFDTVNRLGHSGAGVGYGWLLGPWAPAACSNPPARTGT